MSGQGANSRAPIGDATLPLELRELRDELQTEGPFVFNESPIMGERRVLVGGGGRVLGGGGLMALLGRRRGLCEMFVLLSVALTLFLHLRPVIFSGISS